MLNVCGQFLTVWYIEIEIMQFVTSWNSAEIHLVYIYKHRRGGLAVSSIRKISLSCKMLASLLAAVSHSAFF